MDCRGRYTLCAACEKRIDGEQGFHDRTHRWVSHRKGPLRLDGVYTGIVSHGRGTTASATIRTPEVAVMQDQAFMCAR